MLERKTVYQNIAMPMECWKYPKEEIDKKVNELIELVRARRQGEGEAAKLKRRAETKSGNRQGAYHEPQNTIV